jgi:ketosteroid isomerase-like protein
MEPQENVAIMQRAYEAFNTGDMNTLTELMDETVWHLPAADGDNRVVGIQRSTADRNGKHLDVANCIVFELKDGKVTDGREHFEDLYAWDEFWS